MFCTAKYRRLRLDDTLGKFFFGVTVSDVGGLEWETFQLAEGKKTRRDVIALGEFGNNHINLTDRTATSQRLRFQPRNTETQQQENFTISLT